MADNFPITPGTGRNAATKEVTHSGDTADVQLVQLVGVTGAEGSRTVVEEPFIGFVGSKQKTISTNFTRPADTNAYAAGDAVTNSTSAPSILTFDAVARANAGSGVIVGAVLIDSANQATKGQFELWLYDTSFSADNDNAAFTPSDGETETLIGVIEFNIPKVGDATSGAGGNCVYPVPNLSIPYTCGGSSDDIFGLLVVRNAYTPVSAEKFTVRLFVVQN